MPKVSILVPVYKAEKTLDACVESILAQTFPDFELLLIDEDKRKDIEERRKFLECSRHCVSVPAGCGGTRGRFAHREQHDPRY